MSSTTITVPEIYPDALEREIRTGAEVVILDTRDRESFDAWRIAGVPALRNAPEAELLGAPDRLLAGIGPDSRVRVICHAGIGSRRVAAAIGDRFAEVLSVAGGMIGWSRLLRAATVPSTAPFSVAQFRREARGCLSYIVIAGGEALVVDPGPDVRPYVAEAAARGVRITRIVDTHIHADHISGARELAAATGAALHMSRAALARGVTYATAVRPLTHGDRLRLGPECVEVLALPGHTSDMTGLLLGRTTLIGGDSLFVDSIARPDLEAGAPAAAQAAAVLHATLHERIGPLPDRALLLPGHYAGGRREGPVVTTLGAARDSIAELALPREAFVARILDRLPPPPANHRAIVDVNLGHRRPPDEVARLEVGANSCAARCDPAGAAA